MALFAIIEDGSHQYRVHVGDQITIDLRDGVKPGDAIQFDRVLAAGNLTAGVIGRSAIAGAAVSAEVVDPVERGPKIEVGKFRRRKSYIRHTGHIQRYTTIKITSIAVPGVADDTPAEAPAAATAS